MLVTRTPEWQTPAEGDTGGCRWAWGGRDSTVDPFCPCTFVFFGVLSSPLLVLVLGPCTSLSILRLTFSRFS